MPPDEITRAYLEGRSKRPPRFYTSDPDAQYEKVYEFDVSKLEPQVAFHIFLRTPGLSARLEMCPSTR